MHPMHLATRDGGRWRAVVLGASLVTVALASVAMAQPAADPFELPAVEDGLPGEGKLRRYDGYVKGWRERRRAWSQRVAADKGAVVFLGDSITAGWGDGFRDRFPGMKLANRGIGGDTTRGMLIRLADDVLALDPAAIVLLAGTNDVEVGIDPEAIVRNLTKIIAAIKEHDMRRGTTTPIVLCRVLPSSEQKKRPADTIRRLNGLVDAAVRGDSQITVLDTHTLFADPAGDARPEFFPDLLHLNPAGYDRWAAGLVPLFATLGFMDTAADPFMPEEGFESLFNGRDLTGWGFRPTPPRKPQKNPSPDAPVWVDVTEPVSFAGKAASSDGRYAAINGRLVVKTPAEGRRIQQLWTEREFPDDFVLRLEFRATPNADSGVFIRQPQLQCRDYTLAGPWNALEKYRPQDWNELEVTVAGGVAKATCNGELLTADMKVPPTGPIGLEGDRGQMEYRRIRVKRLARSATTTRRVLLCGGRTALVEISPAHPAGRVEWSWPAATREGWVLPDGNVLLALSKGPGTPHGAAVEVKPVGAGGGDVVWRYDGTQEEVNSIQKTAEGTYVLTEAGPNPRLREIAADGSVTVEFPLACQKQNAHMQSRMARKQADGSYLVPHLLDFAIIRYDAAGQEISRIDTRVPGEPEAKSWPFTAITLADGGVLAGLTNGNRVVEYGPDGRPRWQVTAADTGGAINDACGIQRLPDGNTMIASYRIGADGVRLLEVTPDKRVVWAWKADVPAVHHFHVVAVDGIGVPWPPLR
jgi:lysophospholipase L1-like esterase